MAGLFGTNLGRDLAATAITFALSLAWLRLMDALAARGLIEARLSRKIIHIGTGPLFVACWLLFSPGPLARWLAALVPLGITTQFALVGLGVIRDDGAVKAMTRRGDPAEILRGPLFYGIVFVVCTLAFWRTSPVGIVALMILCGGDGLADVVGRRWGRRPLPHNPDKSWEGSLAMFVGGFSLAAWMTGVFQSAGLLPPPAAWAARLPALAVIAVACAVVESLPLADVDNLTITATAVGLGLLLL